MFSMYRYCVGTVFSRTLPAHADSPHLPLALKNSYPVKFESESLYPSIAHMSDHAFQVVVYGANQGSLNHTHHFHALVLSLYTTMPPE